MEILVSQSRGRGNSEDAGLARGSQPRTASSQATPEKTDVVWPSFFPLSLPPSPFVVHSRFGDPVQYVWPRRVHKSREGSGHEGSGGGDGAACRDSRGEVNTERAAAAAVDIKSTFEEVTHPSTWIYYYEFKVSAGR